jgi:hypothetical protein
VFAALRIRAVSSFVVADDIATPLTGSAESSSALAILATNPRARKSIVGNRVEQTGDQVILLKYRSAAPPAGGRVPTCRELSRKPILPSKNDRSSIMHENAVEKAVEEILTYEVSDDALEAAAEAE